MVNDDSAVVTAIGNRVEGLKLRAGQSDPYGITVSFILYKTNIVT